MIEFEWNPQKARTNRDKHGVSFEEAKSVFYDEFARQFFDEEHSSSEERFIMLGLSNRTGCGFWLFVTVSVPAEVSSGLFPRAKPQLMSESTTKGLHYEERVRFFKDEISA